MLHEWEEDKKLLKNENDEIKSYPKKKNKQKVKEKNKTKNNQK